MKLVQYDIPDCRRKAGYMYFHGVIGSPVTTRIVLTLTRDAYYNSNLLSNAWIVIWIVLLCSARELLQAA